MKIPQRTEREDGKVFWAYRIRNGSRYEVWITKEQFARRIETRRNYRKAKMQEYKDAQAALPPEERDHFGKYNPSTGLYFIRVGTNGKPLYGTKERLDKYKEITKKSKKRYDQNCRKLPLPTVCVGDKHPTIEGLYVRRIFKNKVFYGTYEEMIAKREKMREIYKKYKQNNKQKIRQAQKVCRENLKKKLLENPHLRRHRGDIDPILNKLFWQYDPRGGEIWLNPDVFHEKRKRSSERKRIGRMKQKELRS